MRTIPSGRSTPAIPIRRLSRISKRQRQDWQRPNRRRAEFHLLWPTSEYREDLDILVAGCGTFQAAKHAICWPQARVSAIDISATSLEHTNALARKHGLTILVATQLPIERCPPSTAPST